MITLVWRVSVVCPVCVAQPSLIWPLIDQFSDLTLIFFSPSDLCYHRITHVHGLPYAAIFGFSIHSVWKAENFVSAFEVKLNIYIKFNWIKTSLQKWNKCNYLVLLKALLYTNTCNECHLTGLGIYVCRFRWKGLVETLKDFHFWKHLFFQVGLRYRQHILNILHLKPLSWSLTNKYMSVHIFRKQIETMILRMLCDFNVSHS